MVAVPAYGIVDHVIEKVPSWLVAVFRPMPRLIQPQKLMDESSELELDESQGRAMKE
jgi:hypothetical protein